MAANGLERTIVDGLGEIIRLSLCSLDVELTAPGRDADLMDDRINFFRERVKALRDLRTQLEDELSKSPP